MTWFTSHPDDQWFVDAFAVRELIAEARKLIVQEPDPAQRVARLLAAFQALLRQEGWLPDAFAQPDMTSGMGSGIGQYLLFRAGDGSLSLFSLVVPPGASTPVHDHLAWGIVGLYRGQQREDVFALIAGDPDAGHAQLQRIRERQINPGECYPLLPPEEDIHRVTTISAEPSVSIHLLGNDTGCVWRHRYDPDQGTVTPFRSGYSNQPCDRDPAR